MPQRYVLPAPLDLAGCRSDTPDRTKVGEQVSRPAGPTKVAREPKALRHRIGKTHQTVHVRIRPAGIRWPKLKDCQTAVQPCSSQAFEQPMSAAVGLADREELLCKAPVLRLHRLLLTLTRRSEMRSRPRKRSRDGRAGMLYVRRTIAASNRRSRIRQHATPGKGTESALTVMQS